MVLVSSEDRRCSRVCEDRIFPGDNIYKVLTAGGMCVRIRLRLLPHHEVVCFNTNQARAYPATCVRFHG